MHHTPPAAAADVIASLVVQPPPPVHLHIIGITAFAQYSCAFNIPQLIDAIDRSACPHLSLLPSSFAKAFSAHALPGISNNPDLAASAVLEARKRSSAYSTDAKFVITNTAFTKVKYHPNPLSLLLLIILQASGVIYASGGSPHT